MLERERHRMILQALADEPVLSAARLGDMLGASAATIRRDIATLTEAGAARRVRGGIEAIGQGDRTRLVGMPYLHRRMVAGPAKRAIARAATARLPKGASLVISGGSTTAYLVEFLREDTRDILTNSIPVAFGLAETRNRISLQGGTIYPDQNIVLNPFEDELTRHFRADIFLAGCHGIDRTGPMEADPLVLQSHVRLLRCAEQIVVLADSRKLRQRCATLLTTLDRISCLITNSGAHDDELAPFREADLEVIIVEPDP